MVIEEARSCPTQGKEYPMRISRLTSLIPVLLIALSTPTFAQSTIWNFMGIPQGYNKVRSQIINRRGNTPGLEKKPPLLNIADPANLESDVPAIKAAAEIKKAEDLKKQKIKAIKYLATIGCGCYDKDGKVTNALLAAMEDCTEEVRLEAVKAIAENAEGGCCEICNQRNCCSEEISEQLAKMAYELDDNGCYVEPSERVREAAMEALAICCPNVGYAEIYAPPEGGIEGGDVPTIEGGDELEAPTPPPASDSIVVPPNSSAAISPRMVPAYQPSARLTSSSRRTASTGAGTAQGEVYMVDAARNMAQVHFHHQSQVVPPGTRLQVHVPYNGGSLQVGEMEVVRSFPGSAHVQGMSGLNLARLPRGSTVTYSQN
jgi:hypothetical protein